MINWNIPIWREFTFLTQDGTTQQIAAPTLKQAEKSVMAVLSGKGKLILQKYTFITDKNQIDRMSAWFKAVDEIFRREDTSSSGPK